MYAMHTVSAPCHGTTLHPAAKGGKWKVYLIIHELKTHTLAEVDEERSSRGKGVWWVGVLTISKYFIKYMYNYFLCIYI